MLNNYPLALVLLLHTIPIGYLIMNNDHFALVSSAHKCMDSKVGHVISSYNI